MAIELNIPSQIEKYLSVAFFPATGNEFTLYIANDTNRLYQWNGAAYIEVSQQDAVNWGSIGGDIINQTDLQLALAGKVDVEAGKGLSTNDYTTAEKNKLAGIETGAQVNDVDSVNGYTGAVVLSKSDVGLSNVDNTSDLNKPISTATQSALNAKQDNLGFTPVPTSRTLTINGVTQDLSANRTFTISTGITIGTTAITSGTVGRILFEGAGNVVQESSSLTWDNAANRFQVGTGVNILATNTFPTNANSPYVVLGPYDANFGGDQGALFNLTNNNTTGNSAAIFRFGITSPATGAIGEFGATSSTFSGFQSLVFFNSKGAFPLAFLTNNTERLRIHGTTGNVLIGTTTDAGFRLDVNGTARVQGASYFGTTSGNVGIGTTDASTPFGTAKGLVINAGSGNDAQVRLQNNAVGATASDGGLLSISNTLMYLWNYEAGPLIFGTGNAERLRIFSTGNVLINTTTDAGFRLDVNGTARVQNDLTIGSNRYLKAFRWTQDDVNRALTMESNSPYNFDGVNIISLNNNLLNNTKNILNLGLASTVSTQSSSSTDAFNVLNIPVTYNFTGGTHTVKGIYYNPTLTAMVGTTHFAFHSTSGNIRFENLPTSAAGLPAGTLYNNLGVLMIA